MRKQSLMALAFVAAVAASGPASAAVRGGAHVVADLNMRAGPGVEYDRLATIPSGEPVAVHGCLKDGVWCDIFWAGERGWVAAKYLDYHRRASGKLGSAPALTGPKPVVAAPPTRAAEAAPTVSVTVPVVNYNPQVTQVPVVNVGPQAVQRQVSRRAYREPYLAGLDWRDRRFIGRENYWRGYYRLRDLHDGAWN